MIKFKAGGRGREVVGFGITARNVEMLKAGNPVIVHREEMNLPFDVMIFYGETERDIANELKKHGLIDPEKTVIHDTSDKPKTRQ